ncbi:MAG TPA: hypothetical protein VHM25_05655 [Polyangiaceae bacterium]|nr:hypothetical protein [Polyangiaceae bacterium]
MLWPSLATAAERVPFHLEYAAPANCADEETWLRELSRRSSRVVLARDGQAAPSLRVALTEVDSRVEADLTVVDLDGHATQRMLNASSCAEAVQGSAWVSALWLDPSASEQPAAEEIGLEEPPQRTGESPSAVVARPTESTSSNPPTRSAARAASPLRVGASIQVGTFFTALPSTPLGFAGFLELRAWRKSVVAPLLRLGYVSAGSGVESTERGDAHVGLETFRALGCVLEWPREAWVSLRPCAVWELGQLSGSGEQTTAASKATATWHSVGALGRATFEIFPLVSVDAEAGLIFPLARDQFVFGPAPVVTGYATPALGGTVSLGFTIGAELGGSALAP